MSLNLDLFYCQNLKGSLCGIRNTGKITVTYKYHNPKEKVDSILRHTQEGVELRKTSRLEEVDKNTVGRYIKIADKHAYKLHEELVAFCPLHTKSSVR